MRGFLVEKAPTVVHFHTSEALEWWFGTPFFCRQVITYENSGLLYAAKKTEIHKVSLNNLYLLPNIFVLNMVVMRLI